ncbi:hypothetical protein AAFF_G00022150 [Aldrovandia affinis]|uniref:Reverse transcriptase domain-containing protein n=1 Tax=Aldrovandia affinis TaxID=143900 RepID=A0AAD7S5K1_9TELE|nr:hypothetical protein AAFF_G00022150 [Aldrovandia affinis]
MVWSVEDAILLMLYRMYSHLEKAGSSVRVMFFDFSSAFTIQPHLLRTLLSNMKMHPPIVTWIHDYLLSRLKLVRLNAITSEVVICNARAPQGTVFSPFLFKLYTTDFQYNQ